MSPSFSLVSVGSSFDSVMKLTLLVATAIPYIAIFVAYNWTYAYREAEFDRVVSTMKSVRNRTIPEDIVKSLTAELTLYYNLGNFAVGLLMNVVVSIALTYVAMAQADIVHWPPAMARAASLVPLAVLFAALGAFIANIAELSEKARIRELSSSSFHKAWVKTIASAAVGSLLAVSVKQGFDLWVAFGIGVLPVQTLLDTFADKARKFLNVQLAENRPSRPPDLHLLFGMTDTVISKLADQEITSVQQLAFASPVKLLARTNLEWMVILDLIDQALLYNYLLDKMTKTACLGIRGSIEMGTLVDELKSDNPQEVQQAKAVVARLVTLMEMNEETVIYTIRTIYEDMTVRRLATLLGSVLASGV